MEKGWSIVGRLADLFALLGIWGFSANNKIAIKIIITVIFLVIVVGSYVFSRRTRIVLKDYTYNPQTQTIENVFTYKVLGITCDTLASIYMKKGSATNLVGIVAPVESAGRYLQSNVVLPIDKKSLCKMIGNQRNIKQFFIVPSVRLSELQSKSILIEGKGEKNEEW